MAVVTLDFFQQSVPIVDANGFPTPYFIRQMQLRQQAIENSVPATRKIDTVPDELTGGGDLTQDRTLGLADTPVTPGSYTNTNLTVDQKGRITVAASGSSGGGGYSAIATETIITPKSFFDFTGVPATFKDLILIVYGVVTSTAVDIELNFNADVGANYDWRTENRFATATGSADTKINVGQLNGTGAPAGIPSPLNIEILDYANTVFDKSVLSNGMVAIGTGGNNLVLQQGGSTWLSAAAINQVTLTSLANFDVGTVATLYGRG